VGKIAPDAEVYISTVAGDFAHPTKHDHAFRRRAITHN